MGSSCFARGNDENLNFIEKFIEERKLSAEIELVGSRCENKCSEGPNIWIDDKFYNEVKLEKLQRIMENLANE